MVLIVPFGLTNTLLVIVPILLSSTNLSLNAKDKANKKNMKHSTLLLMMLDMEKKQAAKVSYL